MPICLESAYASGQRRNDDFVHPHRATDGLKMGFSGMRTDIASLTPDFASELRSSTGIRRQGRKSFSPVRCLFERQVMEADCDLVSFDVFDTVLTRNIGEPFALFHEVGSEGVQRKLVNCAPLVFKEVRYAGEQQARGNRHGREVRLHEIYQEIARILDCEDHIEELMAIEMSAEARALRPIPDAALAVTRARQRFGRVVFISDMYLPGAFMEGCLREHGLFLPGDRLYLSSEVGVQKGDGRLFRHVLQSEGIAPSRLVHFGDSVSYDVNAARKLGIQAVHRDAAVNCPAEWALARHSSWNAGYGARLAGASRLARLCCPESDREKKAVWDVGATVTGPLVLLYARWILDRAARLGITQLCFLARDGYFPYLAVKALLKRDLSRAITVRYMHGSRQTYLPLSIASMGEREWNQLTVHGGVACRTINELAAALMMREETIHEHIHRLGFNEADRNRALLPEEITRIRRDALDNPGFNAALLNDIKAFQGLAKRYFEQDGFDPDQGTAIVDSGWTTRSHAPLYGFLRNLGCTNLRLFYLGLMAEETEVPLESVETFIFNYARRNGAIRRDIHYCRPCEALLFARDGRTTGFKEENGVVMPVLADVENPAFMDRLFDSYAGGIQAFLDHAASGDSGSCYRHGLANLAEKVVTRFWCEPTAEEARLWSGMEWQWDPQGKIVYPFARPYGFRNIWSAFRSSAYPECYPQFWVAGSRAISRKQVDWTLSVVVTISSRIRSVLKKLAAVVFQRRAQSGC